MFNNTNLSWFGQIAGAVSRSGYSCTWHFRYQFFLSWIFLFLPYFLFLLLLHPPTLTITASCRCYTAATIATRPLFWDWDRVSFNLSQSGTGMSLRWRLGTWMVLVKKAFFIVFIKRGACSGCCQSESLVLLLAAFLRVLYISLQSLYPPVDGCKQLLNVLRSTLRKERKFLMILWKIASLQF